LGDQPNGEYLQDSNFIDALDQVRTKYRNGGAHDDRISLEVCRAAIADIAGSPNSPGMLARIVLPDAA
jgi:hypothetical protein